MYQKSRSIISKSVMTKTLFLFFVLLLAIFPLFGDVRSVRSRVLQPVGDADIVKSRYANATSITSILNNPMAQITIYNDAVPATLLFDVDIEFGGDWDGEYIKTGIIKELAANAHITFSNTEVTTYLDNIYNPDISDMFMSIGNASDLLTLPDGEHSITLTAYEVIVERNDSGVITSLEKVDKGKGNPLNGTPVTVTFRVVTIGAIVVNEEPGIDSQSLIFTVPEIPVYDSPSESITKTRVTINGPGVTNIIREKTHSKTAASSESYKGYPSDLTNGEVTYDLANLNFHAGGSYSYTIEFIDWNNSIIEDVTGDFSFPTAAISPNTNNTDPFRPVFGWTFTGASDYTNWVKEYRFYLDGKYQGYTDGNEYTLSNPLTPSQTYNWYVMPIHNDGTAFFTSPTSQPYTVPAHTNLTVTLDAPENNTKLIVGETYTFSGTPTFSDGAVEASAEWSIGSQKASGIETNFTPSERYAANSLSVTLKVTDSFGLSGSSAPVNLTVLDPAAAIQGTSRTVNSNTAIIFSIDSTISRDIAEYEWFLDGDSIGDGSSLTYSFPDSGTYLVEVAGTTVSDMNGNTKTVQSESVTITVIGEGPDVSISSPVSGSEIMLGSTVEIAADITNENDLESTIWKITGPDTSQNVSNGSSLTFNPDQSGDYTLTVIVKDTASLISQASIRILVNNPLVEITNIDTNANYPLNSTITPSVNAPNASRYSIFVDGSEISGSTVALAGLGIGEHKIKVRAFWNTINGDYRDSDTILFEVVDLTPPEVTIEFPSDDMVWKTGITYSLEGKIESASAISDSWWVVDGVSQSNESYTPAAGSKKRITVSYQAVNADAITGAVSVSVRIADPSVFVSAPADSTILKGSKVLVNASAVDSELFWLVDGEEIDDWDKTFNTTGLHTLQAGWRMEAVNSFGSTDEFTGLSDVMEFTVYTDVPPEILKAIPNNQFIRNAVNVDLTFQVDPSSENNLKPTQWKIRNNGTLLGEVTGYSATTRFTEPGQYTVLAEVQDDYGFTVTREWTVKIINPSIAITSPAEGTINKLGAVPVPVIDAKEITSYSLQVDGENITAAEFSNLAVGSYTLTAVGEYYVTDQVEPVKISSNPVNFSIADMTPPSFTLSGIQNGDRILSGNQYTFTADPSGEETFEWIKDGSVESTGNELIFTPAGGDGIESFILRGKLNGITVEKPFSVQVIDPSFSIKLPETSIQNNGNKVYPIGTPIQLKSEAKNIDAIEWKVGGTTITGTAYTFNTSGAKTITATARAKNVRLSDGTYGEYVLDSVSETITIADAVKISNLNVSDLIYAGELLSVKVETSGEDAYISSITYSVDGVIYAVKQAPIEKNISISGLKAGSHKITVKTVDVFGKTSLMEKNISVYNPLKIEITQPLNGSRISPDSNVLASFKVVAGQYKSCVWKIGTTAINNSNFTSGSLGKLAPGSHVISVEATDKNNKTVSANVTIEVQSDFQLNLLSPLTGTKLIEGNSILCKVSIQKVAGASVDLTNAAGLINWYVDDDPVGSGLTYTYTGTAGTHSIYAQYKNDDIDMERSTPVNEIEVRALANPVIMSPANGSAITYSLGNNILLKAAGEPGAIFSWLVNNTVVAVGKETSFNPNGLTGSQQLRLQMSAQGQTKAVSSTMTLILNKPPELTLSAPASQYTGNTLTWTAKASDFEDNQSNLNVAVSYFLDGVPIAPGAGKLLTNADIGQHILMATAVDSSGISVKKQVAITVESSDLNLTLQSPAAGDTYFKNYPILLKAILADNKSGVSGTYTWIAEYLDNPGQAAQEFSGNSINFEPSVIGEIAITAKFTDTNGRVRGLKKISIRVNNAPLSLGIHWPYGLVVNAGQKLNPELMGKPEDESGEIVWALNGAVVPDISDFSSPEVPGAYTLSVQFLRGDGSSSTAKVDFSVNKIPEVTITSPVNSSQYILGKPIILSAQVQDDQPYNGSIIWNLNGSELGTGNPFVLKNSGIGDLEITGTGVDQYGAKADSAPISIKVYQPLSKVVPTVNGGSTSFFLSDSGAALNAELEYTGGISPVTVWTLRQGENTAEKTGQSASFAYAELINTEVQFIEGSAMLTAVVTDTGLADVTKQELFRKDFPLTFFTGETIAELVTPTPEDTFFVGDAVPLTLNMKGFASPQFKVGINSEEPSVVVFTPSEGLYISTIAGTNFASEGIYELLIKVLEGETEKEEIPFTLNVYTKRTGIFVDDAPAEINLDNGPGVVTAVIAGFEEADFDTIQWRTDIAVEPVGTGNTLDLAEAGLVPGNRTISVELLLDGNIVAQNSFIIKVFGQMTISVTPEEELIIIQKGAVQTLATLIRDRDGTEVPSENIEWSSHLNGILGTGTTLALESLPDLAIGEHIITIEAEGVFGESISVLKKVQVNQALQEVIPESETDPGTQDQGTPEQPLPQTTLTGGTEVVVIEEEPETLPDWWPAWL